MDEKEIEARQGAHDLLSKLELGAVSGYGLGIIDDGALAQISQAISLKRIADMLEAVTMPTDGKGGSGPLEVSVYARTETL